MRPIKKIWWALFLTMPFFALNAGNVLAAADDETPDVTARVARISFLSGEAQIRRADQTDWERATNNLPLVEGDEIATDQGARLEIQFNSQSFLRLSENAYLKVTTLRDEGIAVSLPNGSLSVRLLDFDRDRAYFEIDAPQTTVSVEKAGLYRVDASGKNDAAIRVSVAESGQARVYSENSGFTLKNGRRATVRLAGEYAGEWETADAAKYADEFDEWVLQRDAIITRRLQKADYDKYYDRDFYGAEDLNEYGEWVYTKKYGYVWRPFKDSVASYGDWSPYRYGQWRWLPAYGWAWVNDEPWGWATYHHGRWIYDDGDWSWTPYPQTRGRRSWWRPALVVLSQIADNICWYPLPYHYNYYNYNYYYVDRRRYHTRITNNTTVVVNPTPNPLVNPRPFSTNGFNTKKALPATDAIPTTGVVTIDASAFGRGRGKFRTAPAETAIRVLAEAPSETIKPAMLPTLREINGKSGREILNDNPVRSAIPVRTGAIERTSGVAAGENLRRTRILGNRPPVEDPPRPENEGDLESPPIRRPTGAVKRQPRPEPSAGDETQIRQIRPTLESKETRREQIRSADGEENGVQSPGRIRRGRENREIAPPVEDQPRDEPVQRPQQMRRERPEPPREQPPREEAAPRIHPQPEDTPREKPVRPQSPSPKQESPAEGKPAAPSRGRMKREGEENKR